MLGGADTTVAKMNAKAASLGAANTHAATPSGLDGPGGSGASTAHDLAVIFRAAMANPMFAHITSEPSAMFPGDNGDHPITNQDELLQRYPGAIGGKTGFTNAARKTFVGAAARGGRRSGGRHDVRVDQTGRPDVLGSGRQPVRLGFRAEPAVQHRLAVIRARLNRRETGYQVGEQRNSLLLDIGFRQHPRTRAAPSNTLVINATSTGNVSSPKLSAPGKRPRGVVDLGGVLAREPRADGR